MGKRLFFFLALIGLIVLVAAETGDHDHHNGMEHDGHDHDDHDHDEHMHDDHDDHEGHDHDDHDDHDHEEHMEHEYSSPEPESSAVCFPADAQVIVPGGVKAISELAIGDRVLVADGQFSEVVMFTHRDAVYKGTYVELVTDSNTIQLTRGHYLYANGNLVPSETVKTGDMLTLADGSEAAVTAVHEAKNTGLYNPQTAHGDIVVGGVVASTYTTFVNPSAAHTLLAPIRALFHAGGVTALDSFSGLFGTVSA